MNTLTNLLSHKRENLLSIFLTAGFPELNSTPTVIKALEKHGVDFLEVGIPYSDPLADGPTIQQTSTRAIANGMTVGTLFDHLDTLKGQISIPLILMGYLNPVLQFGIEKFCKRAQNAGVAGVILPDLPLDEYEEKYKQLFADHNLHVIFLITPNTKSERIGLIDSLSSSFIYAVSSSATTGKQNEFAPEQLDYLKRLKAMNLKNPVMVGFGIHNPSTLNAVWDNASGAIIGSAFMKLLPNFVSEEEAVVRLMDQLGVSAMER